MELPVITERFKHVELEINTVCNTSCFGCDRFSDVASKGVPSMTVEQVQHFVDESVELNWEWERIRFLGGEPTLHKDFRDLIEVLLRYRERFPKVFLQVLTNGIPGKCDEYRPWLEENRISLHAEQKEKGITPIWFRNTRIVPVDRDESLRKECEICHGRGEYDVHMAKDMGPDWLTCETCDGRGYTIVGELAPCGIFGIRGCGIALTNHGYFLDGAGASIARVAGYDIGVMNLKDVTWDSMYEQSKVLCRVCGHWNPPDKEITKQVTETGEITGEFWTKALAAYKENRPQLRMYGPQPKTSLL